MDFWKYDCNTSYNNNHSLLQIYLLTTKRDFGLKEVEYKHKIFQLQMKCDSLQQKIKSYER